jgi:hypothetical protein
LTPGANVARVYDYLLGGTHNFLADQDVARAIVAVEPNAPASRAYRRAATADLRMRSHPGVMRFFDGFELAAPGLVALPYWRPDAPAELAGDAGKFWGGLAGVGRKSS